MRTMEEAFLLGWAHGINEMGRAAFCPDSLDPKRTPEMAIAEAMQNLREIIEAEEVDVVAEDPVIQLCVEAAGGWT